VPERTLKELDAICAKVRANFDAKDAAREQGLPLAREVIRNSANSIRATHRGEYDEARGLMEKSALLLAEAHQALRAHPDVHYAGFLQDAEKEHAEANQTYALVRGEALPDPDTLGVGYAPYLNGLGEAVGELRRHALDRVRRSDIGWGERILEKMDEIYYAMVSFDYPPAISGGLRRTADVTRSLIEKTRGDITNAIRQQQLERALTQVERTVREWASQPGVARGTGSDEPGAAG
jgi:translin